MSVLHPIYLTRALLDKQTKRAATLKKKSGLIFVSSVWGEQPASGVVPYSSSKSFSKYLGVGLNHELRETVDVMVYSPGLVETNLTKGKTGFDKINT